MRLIASLGLALTMGAVCAPVHGQEPEKPRPQPPPGRNGFAEIIQLDANGDKIIEREEVPESGREAFDRLLEHGDSNQNGRLEIDELRALGATIRAAGGAGGGLQRLLRMDKDGDGKISKDEFEGPERNFARLDADRDGFITRKEARAGGPAQPLAGAMLERLKAMDSDHDGSISKDEFRGPEPQFARLDRDGDGQISQDELSRPAGPPADGADRPLLRRLRAMDSDGDGKITKKEFQGRDAMFSRLDRDGDGVLSQDELTPPDAPDGERPLRQRLRQMDTDGDGQISKDEFKGPMPLFDRLDTNGDGVINREDRPPGPDRPRTERPSAKPKTDS